MNVSISSDGTDRASAINAAMVYKHYNNIEASARATNGKTVLLAKTYRNFEANLILAAFETDITIDSKGKYKPTSVIVKARE